jgi:hypothetical protein
MKIANKDARHFVQKEHPFEGSNLYAQFGCNHDTGETWYVVYSYGLHYPMFVKANGVWFENEDKYSPTTSKHRSQAHPLCPTVLLATRHMLALSKDGYTALAGQRILHG